MSYNHELKQVQSAEVATTPETDVDVKKLIPVRQADGSICYKQNKNYRGESFPLDIERHNLLMDPDYGWKYFNFNPDSQNGKALIMKYTNVDEEGFRYVMSMDGHPVYDENAIATEVLNRLHINYMNKNWVRIHT